MLRVSVETQSEFDSRRGNEPSSYYKRTEIAGVCEVWYKKTNGNVIIVPLSQE